MSVQPLFFAAARALLRLSELSAAVSGRMNAADRLFDFRLSGRFGGFSGLFRSSFRRGSRRLGGYRRSPGGFWGRLVSAVREVLHQWLTQAVAQYAQTRHQNYHQQSGEELPALAFLALVQAVFAVLYLDVLFLHDIS